MAPDTIMTPGAPWPASLHALLRARGFVRAGSLWRLHDLWLSASGRWYMFSTPANQANEWSLSRSLGEPGLWKWVHNGTPWHRVFEIPAWAISEELEEDRFGAGGPASFASVLDWALSTRGGEVMQGWRPPAHDLVESWLSRGALTVQADGVIRQGEVILEPTRWALRIPVLPQLVPGLPEARRRALTELVAHAQRCWAMVRIGIPANTSPAALVAEVDFTGAPHSELLFSAGLDVLKHVVAWLAETAEVVADPSLEIQSLALVGANTATPNERNI